MSIEDKSLDKLYEYRGKFEEFLILAKAFGSIRLGDEVLSYDQVQDELIKVKAEIASRVSKTKLRRL